MITEDPGCYVTRILVIMETPLPVWACGEWSEIVLRDDD